jgi:signal transduction histidine kinase
VDGGGSRIVQSFENLFGNSVEHGPTDSRTQSDDAVEHGSTSPDSQAHRNAVEHGAVGVAVRTGTTPDGFYVEDNGPGIPSEKRSAVFEHGHTSNDEGAGFGLAIVENVSSAHG